MAVLDTQARRHLLDRLAGTLDAEFFDAWCRNLEVRELGDDVFEVPCPSRLCLNILEPRLRRPLEEALREMTGRGSVVRFTVEEGALEPEPVPVPPRPQTRPEGFEGVPLREDFVFENLVQGTSNRFAIAAGMRVADAPFEETLFVHGKSGVGKTHILQAIGHRARKAHPELRVAYLPCETFINDFLESLRTHRTEDFRAKYRAIHFLIIDDVDQLARKEATQNEFFHLFNHLLFHRRQIVLSSDVPPQAIHTLQERLFSRLSSGVVARVDPPDFEMRVAILRAKAARKGRELPADVCRYIAEQFTDNVRDLESAVNTVVALESLTGRPLTVELAREAIRDRLAAPAPQMTLEALLILVAEKFGLLPSDLRRRTKKPRIVEARGVFAYFCHVLLKFSLRELAGFLEMASHNSVALAVRSVRRRMERDLEFRSLVLSLEEEIRRRRKQ